MHLHADTCMRRTPTRRTMHALHTTYRSASTLHLSLHNPTCRSAQAPGNPITHILTNAGAAAPAPDRTHPAPAPRPTSTCPLGPAAIAADAANTNPQPPQQGQPAFQWLSRRRVTRCGCARQPTRLSRRSCSGSYRRWRRRMAGRCEYACVQSACGLLLGRCSLVLGCMGLCAQAEHVADSLRWECAVVGPPVHG